MLAELIEPSTSANIFVCVVGFGNETRGAITDQEKTSDSEQFAQT